MRDKEKSVWFISYLLHVFVCCNGDAGGWVLPVCVSSLHGLPTSDCRSTACEGMRTHSLTHRRTHSHTRGKERRRRGGVGVECGGAVREGTSGPSSFSVWWCEDKINRLAEDFIQLVHHQAAERRAAGWIPGDCNIKSSKIRPVIFLWCLKSIIHPLGFYAAKNIFPKIQQWEKAC